MGFFDGGGKSVKFESDGDFVRGNIVGQHDPATRKEVPYLESQQTDYTTKQPATYQDGNPKMQAIILLSTTDRADEDDDGQRTLYVNKTRMKRAIQDALRAAGERELRVGGELTVQRTGTEPSKQGSPAQTFAAWYTAPVGGLAAEPPAPAAAPAAPPAAAPAAAAPVPAAAPAAVAPPAPAAAPVAPPAPAAPPAPSAPAAPPADGGSNIPF